MSSWKTRVELFVLAVLQYYSLIIFTNQTFSWLHREVVLGLVSAVEAPLLGWAWRKRACATGELPGIVGASTSNLDVGSLSVEYIYYN